MHQHKETKEKHDSPTGQSSQSLGQRCAHVCELLFKGLTFVFALIATLAFHPMLREWVQDKRLAEGKVLSVAAVCTFSLIPFALAALCWMCEWHIQKRSRGACVGEIFFASLRSVFAFVGALALLPMLWELVMGWPECLVIWKGSSVVIWVKASVTMAWSLSFVLFALATLCWMTALGFRLRAKGEGKEKTYRPKAFTRAFHAAFFLLPFATSLNFFLFTFVLKGCRHWETKHSCALGVLSAFAVFAISMWRRSSQKEAEKRFRVASQTLETPPKDKRFLILCIVALISAFLGVHIVAFYWKGGGDFSFALFLCIAVFATAKACFEWGALIHQAILGKDQVRAVAETCLLVFMSSVLTLAVTLW